MLELRNFAGKRKPNPQSRIFEQKTGGQQQNSLQRSFSGCVSSKNSALKIGRPRVNKYADTSSDFPAVDRTLTGYSGLQPVENPQRFLCLGGNTNFSSQMGRRGTAGDRRDETDQIEDEQPCNGYVGRDPKLRGCQAPIYLNPRCIKFESVDYLTASSKKCHRPRNRRPRSTNGAEPGGQSNGKSGSERGISGQERLTTSEPAGEPVEPPETLPVHVAAVSAVFAKMNVYDKDVSGSLLPLLEASLIHAPCSVHGKVSENRQPGTNDVENVSTCKRISWLTLDLAENYISDQGVQVLVDWLVKHIDLVRLRSLKVYRNAVGDAGAIALAALIEQSPWPVEEVHFSHNSVGDVGASKFMAAFLYCYQPKSKAGGLAPNFRSMPGAPVYPRLDPFRPVYLPVWIRLEYNLIQNTEELLASLAKGLQERKGSEGRKTVIACFAEKSGMSVKDPNCSPKRCSGASARLSPLFHLYSFTHQLKPTRGNGHPTMSAGSGSAATSSLGSPAAWPPINQPTIVSTHSRTLTDGSKPDPPNRAAHEKDPRLYPAAGSSSSHAQNASRFLPLHLNGLLRPQLQAGPMEPIELWNNPAIPASSRNLQLCSKQVSQNNEDGVEDGSTAIPSVINSKPSAQQPLGNLQNINCFSSGVLLPSVEENESSAGSMAGPLPAGEPDAKIVSKKMKLSRRLLNMSRASDSVGGSCNASFPDRLSPQGSSSTSTNRDSSITHTSSQKYQDVRAGSEQENVKFQFVDTPNAYNFQSTIGDITPSLDDQETYCPMAQDLAELHCPSMSAARTFRNWSFDESLRKQQEPSENTLPDVQKIDEQEPVRSECLNEVPEVPGSLPAVFNVFPDPRACVVLNNSQRFSLSWRSLVEWKQRDLMVAGRRGRITGSTIIFWLTSASEKVLRKSISPSLFEALRLYGLIRSIEAELDVPRNANFLPSGVFEIPAPGFSGSNGRVLTNNAPPTTSEERLSYFSLSSPAPPVQEDHCKKEVEILNASSPHFVAMDIMRAAQCVARLSLSTSRTIILSDNCELYSQVIQNKTTFAACLQTVSSFGAPHERSQAGEGWPWKIMPTVCSVEYITQEMEELIKQRRRSEYCQSLADSRRIPDSSMTPSEMFEREKFRRAVGIYPSFTLPFDLNINILDVLLRALDQTDRYFQQSQSAHSQVEASLLATAPNTRGTCQGQASSPAHECNRSLQPVLGASGTPIWRQNIYYGPSEEESLHSRGGVPPSQTLPASTPPRLTSDSDRNRNRTETVTARTFSGEFLLLKGGVPKGHCYSRAPSFAPTLDSTCGDIDRCPQSFRGPICGEQVGPPSPDPLLDNGMQRDSGYGNLEGNSMAGVMAVRSREMSCSAEQMNRSSASAQPNGFPSGEHQRKDLIHETLSAMTHLTAVLSALRISLVNRSTTNQSAINGDPTSPHSGLTSRQQQPHLAGHYDGRSSEVEAVGECLAAIECLMTRWNECVAKPSSNGLIAVQQHNDAPLPPVYNGAYSSLQAMDGRIFTSLASNHRSSNTQTSNCGATGSAVSPGPTAAAGTANAAQFVGPVRVCSTSEFSTAGLDTEVRTNLRNGGSSPQKSQSVSKPDARASSTVCGGAAARSANATTTTGSSVEAKSTSGPSSRSSQSSPAYFTQLVSRLNQRLNDSQTTTTHHQVVSEN